MSKQHLTPETIARRKAQFAAYQKENFVNPVKRRPGIAGMDQAMLKRLDHQLTATEVSLPELARRFKVSNKALHAYLEVKFGLRVGALKKFDNTQVRIPIV